MPGVEGSIGVKARMNAHGVTAGETVGSCAREVGG